MKKNFASYFRDILHDRAVFLSVLAFLFAVVAAATVVSFNIHVSESQVVNRYTRFGVTNFYRDDWAYLIMYIIYFVMVAIVYIETIRRVFVKKGRDLAVSISVLGIITVVISATLMFNLLKATSLV